MSWLRNPTTSGFTVIEYNNTDSSGTNLWVRKDFIADGNAGEYRMLGLPMMYTGNGISTYRLSYKNVAGTIIRSDLV